MLHTSDNPVGIDLCGSFVWSGTKVIRLRDLSGWQSSHRIPDRLTSSTELFVSELCAPDLEKDIDETYQALKKHYSCRRKDLLSSVAEDGTAAIETPYFSYSVVVRLNPEDPSELIWTRRIDGIRSLEDLRRPAFAQVFDCKFDTVAIEFPHDINVSEFIDLAEEAQIPGLNLEYDRDFSHCSLRLSGSETGKIRLTACSISLEHEMPATALSLLSSFETIYSLVSSSHLKPFLGFEGK